MIMNFITAVDSLSRAVSNRTNHSYNTFRNLLESVVYLIRQKVFNEERRGLPLIERRIKKLGREKRGVMR